MEKVELKKRNLISIPEAAAKLDVSRTVLRNLVYREEIPFYKIGRDYKFEVSELEKWIQSRRGKYRV